MEKGLIRADKRNYLWDQRAVAVREGICEWCGAYLKFQDFSRLQWQL